MASDSECSFSVDAFMFRAETNRKATASPGPLKGTVVRWRLLFMIVENKYVSLLTLFNPFVIFVSKPRLGSFGFLGKGAVLRIGSFFFYAYGG